MTEHPPMNYGTHCPTYETRSRAQFHAQKVATLFEPLLGSLRLARSTADIWYALSQLLINYNYVFSERFRGPSELLFGDVETSRRCSDSPEMTACSPQMPSACSACMYKETLIRMFRAMCPYAGGSELDTAERRVDSMVKNRYPLHQVSQAVRASDLERSYNNLSTPLIGPLGHLKGETYAVGGRPLVISTTFPIVPAERKAFFARIGSEAALFAIDQNTKSMVPVLQKILSFAYLYGFAMSRQYHGTGEVKPVIGEWATKVFDCPPCKPAPVNMHHVQLGIVRAPPAEGTPEAAAYYEPYRTCYRCRLCQMWKDIAKLMIGNDPAALEQMYLDINLRFHSPDLPPMEKMTAEDLKRSDAILSAKRAGSTIMARRVVESNAALQQVAAAEPPPATSTRPSVSTSPLKRKEYASNPATGAAPSASASASETPTSIEPAGTVTADGEAASPQLKRRRVAMSVVHPPVVEVKLNDAYLNIDLRLRPDEKKAVLKTATEHANAVNLEHANEYDRHLKAALEHPALKALWVGYFAKPYDPTKKLRSMMTVLSTKKTFVKWIADFEGTFKPPKGTRLPMPKIEDPMIDAFHTHCIERLTELFWANVEIGPDTTDDRADWVDFIRMAQLEEMQTYNTVEEAIKHFEWVREKMKINRPLLFHRGLWAMTIHLIENRFKNEEVVADKTTTGEPDFDLYWEYGAICRCSFAARKLVIDSVGLTWTDFKFLLRIRRGRPRPVDRFIDGLSEATDDRSPYHRWKSTPEEDTVFAQLYGEPDAVEDDA